MTPSAQYEQSMHEKAMLYVRLHNKLWCIKGCTEIVTVAVTLQIILYIIHIHVVCVCVRVFVHPHRERREKRMC